MKFDCLRLVKLLIVFVFLSSCNRDSDTIHEETYFPLPDQIDPAERFDSEEHSIYLQPLVSGLQIPWGMAFLPNGSVLVTERVGQLRIIEQGVLNEEPIDGVPEVRMGGTSGLMDIAVHPDYEENGWIYLAYSSPDDDGEQHNTAIMRARLDGHTLVDQEVIFQGEPMTERPSHSGSRMLFHDGYLFFTIGDRGTMEWSQDLDSHAGTVLRIYDDGSIPNDNPFLDTEGALPEIYTYGHRNIQGLDTDPATGHMWAVEHGPRGGDELNLIEGGNNYGWPVISASGIADDGEIITELREKEGMVSYTYEWTPALAPSALSFVRSDRYPGWEGNMLITGLAGMRIVRLVIDDREVIHEEHLFEGIGRIRNVVIGPDGFIYIANDTTGEILRLLPSSVVH